MTAHTKTFRGESIEDLLPQIRDELGPDAVITRQREGIVGGIGGFFGKRCVEVEAQAPAGDDIAEALPRSVPTRHVLDAYDGGDDPIAREGMESDVLRRFVQGSAPFAAHLEAAGAPPALDDEPDLEETLPGALGAPDAPAAGLRFAADDDEDDEDDDRDSRRPRRQRREPTRAAVVTARRRAAEEEAVRRRLVELGLPEATVAALAREVDQHHLPFAPHESYEDGMRRALASLIRAKHGWKTKQRTIALVGPPGSGKTFTAARLCHAYATASDLSVGTLSLESTADAYRLGTLTEALDIDIRVADTAAQAKRAALRMHEADLVVVDTPPMSPGDPEGIERLAALLEAAGVDEVHLVLPASIDLRAALSLGEALRGHIDVDRVVFTRLDEVASAAVAVGVSLALRKPISYLTAGRDAQGGLRPADATELARLVLP
jgi:flagellar biosynthesis GTPase FlhF